VELVLVVAADCGSVEGLRSQLDYYVGELVESGCLSAFELLFFESAQDQVCPIKNVNQD
jgi:hypothetical protein